MRCDFCSSHEVSWSYPAHDFTMPYSRMDEELADNTEHWGSRGGWAACDTCHELIQADDREGLARRCSITFVARAKHDPMIPRAGKRTRASQHMRHFRELHEEFWRHRAGAPVRLTQVLPVVMVPDSQHKEAR